MPIAEWLDEAARELRYAARSLAERPIVALTCVATLAICIGANISLFGMVDAVLLRPLPYPHADRLAEVVSEERENGVEQSEDSQTGRTWFLLRDHAPGLDAAVSSALASGVNVSIGDRPEYLRLERVGSGFFRVLEVAPLLGREFSSAEDRPAGPRAVLLSNRLWRRRFGAERAVLGRVVMVQGEPHTVVGVMPAALLTTAEADLWTPLAASTSGEGADENYRVTVRLRPGTTWAAAASQVAAVGQVAFAERHAKEPSLHLALVPLQRGLTADLRAPLFVLWGAAAAVLAIGCVNVASLLLARGAGRTREIAIRLALGAERRAILRQLLAESLLLVAGGSLGGLLLGGWGLGIVGWMARDSLHLWQPMAIDGRALAAVASVALSATLAFGLLPAAQLGRIDVRGALGEGGEGSTSGRPHRLRRSLVVAEVALGVVLLIGAGLFLRTFQALRSLPPGFDPDHVITAQMSLADARYATSRRVNDLFAAGLGRIRAIPGVERAAVGLALPYERCLRLGVQFLDGPEARGPKRNTTLAYVTPDYFAALRIPLLRGRPLLDGDTPAAEKVVVVNRTFVRRYLAGEEPIGRQVKMAGTARRIVGVVGDFQQDTGGSRDLGPLAVLPAAFFPAAQADDEMLRLVHSWFSPSWVVRTAGAAAAAGMRQAVEAVDPQLPIASFHTMHELARHATAEQRFQAVLLTTLAVPALLLAALGIYGLILHSVVERAKEVGIRIALGATRGQTIRAVAMPGVWLASMGVLLGCGLAGMAARSLRYLIWGVPPTDPTTFGGVAAGLMAVAALASLLPTLRLTQIDPAATLRLAPEGAGGGRGPSLLRWSARRLARTPAQPALVRHPLRTAGATGEIQRRAVRERVLVWIQRPGASRQDWDIPAGLTLRNFDFDLQPPAVARRLDELKTCDWIRQRRRTLIQGPPRSGKSHLAAGLGAAAIERGFSVAFIEVEELVRTMGRDAARSSRWISSWTFPRHDLLIIDRFSYRDLGWPEASLIVQLIRCRERSTLVTTRDPLADWSPPDRGIAEALRDCLLDGCHVVKTASEAYRRGRPGTP